MNTDAFTTAASERALGIAMETFKPGFDPENHPSVYRLLCDMAEWARDYLARQAPKPIPDESEMEVVGEWLVVRNAQEPEYPAGPEYGPYPYSDAAPLVHLARVAGFPPEQQETTDAEVLAALNAQGVIVSPKMHPAPSLDYWGERATESMRAALVAAKEARGHEHEWRPKQNVTTKGYAMPAHEACTCGAAKEARA